MDQHPSTSNTPILRRSISAEGPSNIYRPTLNLPSRSPLLLKFRVKKNCPLDEFLTHRGLFKDIYTLEELLKILSGCFTYKRGDDNSIPRVCPPDLLPVFGRPTVRIPDLLKLLGNQIECLGSPLQNCNSSENTNLGEALVNSNRIELKSNDMFSSFIFIPNSELHIYLQRTTRITKHEYTLHEILSVLKERISSNCMYDTTNPTVIICDPNLAKALGCRALYISNLCRKVLQQLIRNGRQPGIFGNIDFHYMTENIKIKPWDGLLIAETHLSNIENEFSLVLENLQNPNARFKISTSLREVLMLAPNTEQFLRDPQIYTIKEVFLMFSKYFTWKKSLFCVAGTGDIFLFGQDPIGKVLGIKSMHNSQLRFFAAKHLSLAQQTSLNSDIALRIENTNTKNEKVAIESKENETSYRKEENSITDVSCRGKSSETDGQSEDMIPTLRKSVSMPARSTNLSIVDILESGTRKRHASGDVQFSSKRNRFYEKDPAVLLASLSDHKDAKQPQAPVQTNNALPDIQEIEEDVTKKESNEIESKKVEESECKEKNNEESCSASDKGNISSGESEVENDYSEEEYEVDSDEENKKKVRPPQAGGGGTESDSSCDNSDIDISVVRPVVTILPDESNLADNSDDDFDKDVSMVKTKMPYHCYRCNSLQMPGVWYCIPCWRQRSNWLPPRPKPYKKRKLQNENIPSSQIKKNIQTINLNQAQNDKMLSPQENKNEASISSTPSNDVVKINFDKPSSSTLDRIRRSVTPDTDKVDSADSSNEEQDNIVKGDSGFCSANSKENLFTSEKSSRNVDKRISFTIEATETDGGYEPTKITKENSSAKKSEPKDVEGNFSANKLTIQGFREDGKSSSDNLCMFCCTNKKDTSLIHGKIGHQICCYPCGKRVWREQGRCPVCNRKVEKIVRIFQD